MDLFTREDLKTLLAEERTPCVSIFMPTHRGGKEEDRIRWKGHVRAAEEHLVAAGQRAPEVKDLLRPAQLSGNGRFFVLALSQNAVRPSRITHFGSPLIHS